MAATVTLPSAEEIRITREFDAPPHLVYRAWTTPELVRRWWTGGRGEVTSIEIDLRTGGTWRYAMVADDGVAVVFSGEYREVVPDQRLVYTEVKQDRDVHRAYMGDGLDDAMDHLEQVARALARDGR